MIALLASFVLAVLIVLYFLRNKPKGDALLLVGPSDAGKTAILSRLLYNKSVPTHSSLQVNTAQVGQLRVIDVPGHPRLRDQFKDYLKDAKTVAFVVDSSTISRNGAAVAEHLHAVLQESPQNLVIVAHKSDLLKSGGAVGRVKSVLERELARQSVQIELDHIVCTSLDELDELLSVT